MKFQQSVVSWQNEGSFGCEAVARALGQPNVPECAVGFLFIYCLYAAKIPLSFCRLFCLFTMNANAPGYGQCGEVVRCEAVRPNHHSNSPCRAPVISRTNVQKFTRPSSSSIGFVSPHGL